MKWIGIRWHDWTHSDNESRKKVIFISREFFTKLIWYSASQSELANFRLIWIFRRIISCTESKTHIYIFKAKLLVQFAVHWHWPQMNWIEVKGLVFGLHCFIFALIGMVCIVPIPIMFTVESCDSGSLRRIRFVKWL